MIQHHFQRESKQNVEQNSAKPSEIRRNSTSILALLPVTYSTIRYRALFRSNVQLASGEINERSSAFEKPVELPERSF